MTIGQEIDRLQKEVLSKPRFWVGDPHWISGDYPISGWKDKLREAGLPELVIDGVKAHFRKCAEDRVEAAAASGYDDEDE